MYDVPPYSMRHIISLHNFNWKLLLIKIHVSKIIIYRMEFIVLKLSQRKRKENEKMITSSKFFVIHSGFVFASSPQNRNCFCIDESKLP